MFNNLIESSSHRKEFRRRGSFLLFTTATYVVLFVITGVVSIYAYDAHLEDQTLEDVVLLPPVEPAVAEAPPKEKSVPPPGDGSNNATVTERAVAMLSVNHPESVPAVISATPNKNLPLPDHGTVPITGIDRDPASSGGPGAPGTGRVAVTPPAQIVNFEEPPPAAVAPRQIPAVVSKGAITGLAISLPKPAYPPIAKQLKIQGAVSVQVLVDESGKVVSAKAISGSTFLVSEAQKAALQARFSPALLSGQPVKVSGVITYNFVLSN